MNSRVTISNCLFYDNDAEMGSDVLYGGDGSLSVENCTFASTAFPNIWKYANDSSGPTRFVNTIIWGHETAFHGPEWIVTYSDVLGGFPGVGNISEDPLFVNADGGDFHLQANSPCIDSASVNGPVNDLDGNARPLDVPGTGRDGTGDEFDMGAYEYIPAPTPTPTMVNPRSDIDESGKVDAADLLHLLCDWYKRSQDG